MKLILIIIFAVILILGMGKVTLAFYYGIAILHGIYGILFLFASLNTSFLKKTISDYVKGWEENQRKLNSICNHNGFDILMGAILTSYAFVISIPMLALPFLLEMFFCIILVDKLRKVLHNEYPKVYEEVVNK